MVDARPLLRIRPPEEASRSVPGVVRGKTFLDPGAKAFDDAWTRQPGSGAGRWSRKHGGARSNMEDARITVVPTSPCGEAGLLFRQRASSTPGSTGLKQGEDGA